MPTVREIASRFGPARVRRSLTGQSSNNSNNTAAQTSSTRTVQFQVEENPALSSSDSPPTSSPDSSPSSTMSLAVPPSHAGEAASAVIHTPNSETEYVQQRRASAAQSMAQRRTSAMQILLQESRVQEERPEEGRHHKRRS